MAQFIDFDEFIKSADGRQWERFALIDDYSRHENDFSMDIANIHYVYQKFNSEYEYAKFDVTIPEEDIVILIDDCCGYRQWGLYATGEERKALQAYPILDEQFLSEIENSMYSNWLYEWAPNITIGNWDYYDILNRIGGNEVFLNLVDKASSKLNENVDEWVPLSIFVDGQDKYGRPNYLGEENIEPPFNYTKKLEEAIVKEICKKIRDINRAKIYDRELKWKENWLTLPVGGDV